MLFCNRLASKRKHFSQRVIRIWVAFIIRSNHMVRQDRLARILDHDVSTREMHIRPCTMRRPKTRRLPRHVSIPHSNRSRIAFSTEREIWWCLCERSSGHPNTPYECHSTAGFSSTMYCHHGGSALLLVLVHCWEA